MSFAADSTEFSMKSLFDGCGGEFVSPCSAAPAAIWRFDKDVVFTGDPRIGFLTIPLGRDPRFADEL